MEVLAVLVAALLVMEIAPQHVGSLQDTAELQSPVYRIL